MTCAELRHDLAILTELIAAIHREDEFDASDAKDLRWASAQFQALSAVLETRRALQGEKDTPVQRSLDDTLAYCASITENILTLLVKLWCHVRVFV